MKLFLVCFILIQLSIVACTQRDGTIDGTGGIDLPAVTTLYGTLDNIYGYKNGVCNEARFNNPSDIAIGNGKAYVTDSNNHVIREIDLTTGEVSLLAGIPGISGSDNGSLLLSKFRNPTGITFYNNALYVSDTSNCSIRKVDLNSKQVSLFAGQVKDLCIDEAGTSVVNGIGSVATFSHPYGITNDGTYLYVADTGVHGIRKVGIVTQVVEHVAGGSNFINVGLQNGPLNFGILFSGPIGVTINGTDLYIADTGNFKIRRVDLSVNPVWAYTKAGGTEGYNDAVGTAALFNSPSGIANDGSYIYVADTKNHVIRKIKISDSSVTTISGVAGSKGNAEGDSTTARYKFPVGMAVYSNYLYIIDKGNHNIKKLNLTTNVVETAWGKK